MTSFDYGKSQLERMITEHPESEYARVLLSNFHHFVALDGSYHRGCGSYMFNGLTYVYQPETFTKQDALFRIGKKATHLLEVGVYVGHSLLILLLSNPTLKVTCVDIDNTVPQRAVNYLNYNFGNRITFLHGRAEDVLPRLPHRTYDLIHIDADHYPDAVTRQFLMCVPLATPRAYVVFDDYEAVQSTIDAWITNGPLEHIETPWCLWTNCITQLR